MVANQTDQSLINLLETLGLTHQEIKIYTTLLTKGSITTLALSRLVGIPRTSLYRTLETMGKNGFVEVVTGSHTTHVKASDAASLELMIARKKREIEQLD